MQVVLAACCSVIAAAMAARLIVPPLPRLAPRVRPYVVASRSALGQAATPLDLELDSTPGGPLGRLFGPPLVAAARRIGRLVESRSDAHLELRLSQAGLASVSVDEHRVRQVSQGAVAAILGGAAAAVVLRAPIGTLAVASGAGFWGVTRARATVDRAIERRAERIRLELPTVNQLLALHVRTGAGPMQAVQRVVARGQGVVVDELETALRRARAGGRESDAFRAVASVTPEPSAARTYELFAVAVERGADLAEGLLALGDQLREARREEVRKQAVRRRAAMLLPTIGILAPIMLLFIAAPLPSIVLGHH
ncbi:MAG: tight adherence protein [Actinomycetota bacterium]|nr:tight adherence protein [Actinomycetota bacterium]